MIIEGVEINNNTRYTGADIKEWWNIGKAYYDSGINQGEWYRCRNNRERDRHMFVALIIEDGAQIKGVPVYHPFIPSLVESDRTKKKKGSIYLFCEGGSVIIT